MDTCSLLEERSFDEFVVVTLGIAKIVICELIE